MPTTVYEKMIYVQFVASCRKDVFDLESQARVVFHVYVRTLGCSN